MALVEECEFCGCSICGVCACIIDFGRRLQKKITDWNLKNPGKLLPPPVIKASKDKRWVLYKDYLSKERIRAGELQKANRHASKLRDKLQEIADIDMSKFFPDFQVIVNVKCSRVPRY